MTSASIDGLLVTALMGSFLYIFIVYEGDLLVAGI